MNLFEVVQRLVADEDGAPATEYALLAALVAVAMILGATFLGTSVNGIFNGLGNKVTSSSSSL